MLIFIIPNVSTRLYSSQISTATIAAMVAETIAGQTLCVRALGRTRCSDSSDVSRRTVIASLDVIYKWWW